MSTRRAKKNAPVDSQVAPSHGRGSSWELAREIIRLIDEGKYAAGDRLPSHRQLMETHDLTSGVVSYAMTILSDQGHVERRHGSGVYVSKRSATKGQARQQNGLYALVVPEIESGMYLSIQAGMENAAQKQRGQLITMTTGGSVMRQADVLLQLIDREVAGVAVVPCYDPPHAYQLRHLQRAKIPLVLLHRAMEGVPAPVLEAPFLEIGRMAGRMIGKHKHRIAGAVCGMQSDSLLQYLAGYRQALKQTGATLSDEFTMSSESMLVTPEDYANHRLKVEEFVRSIRAARGKRPTALFVSFDRLANLVYWEAVRQGVRIPEELSIVSFAGNRTLGSTPHLASVVADEFQTGQRACELIDEIQAGTRPFDSDAKFPISIAFDEGETLAGPGK